MSPWTISSTARAIRARFRAKATTPNPARPRAYFSLHPKLRLPGKTQCLVQILTFKSHPWCVKTKLSCDASFNFQNLKMWKRSLCARLPSNSNSWRCENEAFVQCLRQIPRVEAMKTQLLCEASFKFQKLKLWAHVFNWAVPIKKVSQHMQNTIAQHHQRRENVTLNHQFYCARNPS